MIRQGFYAMKRRLGGSKLTPREKLLVNWYPCPGCQPHPIPDGRRKDILFEHYHNRPRKSWSVYWRSHKKEYTDLLYKLNIHHST